MAVSEANRSVGFSCCLGVVIAASGYPGDYPKGTEISLGQDTEDTKVFHAGTAMNGVQPITSGGRVLCVTALGSGVQKLKLKLTSG